MLKEGGAGASPAAVTDGAGLSIVHFDFDRYFIKDEDRPVLERNAKWLGKNPGAKVQIEGHADERGDNEYNLALGDRRAGSVKRFLVDLNIGEERLSTISYGEEKPVDKGHDDDAWSRNRRAEFRVE
ncbi:MAG: peptidoglycan-associated lipoprotein Pal [Deltaproteobacteria bacterium]|nr:peptidoglycan-associated lipoprotein Pal [Deltaproteobacteria bacterium]